MQNAHRNHAGLIDNLNDSVSARRTVISSGIADIHRRALSQFFTPPNVGEFIASMSEVRKETLRILDPGAGMGSLFAALVQEMSSRPHPPKAIQVTAVEIDPLLRRHLLDTMAECDQHCAAAGIRFVGEVIGADFIEMSAGIFATQISLDAKERLEADVVITNPPYKKINSNSAERRYLKQLGIETTNLYAAFLAISARLLREGGELLAITPRSFCNGTYFRPFREMFLQSMQFTRIHVLESRNEAFAEDSVLQENIVFRAVKGMPRSSVRVTTGSLSPNGFSFGREIPYHDLVHPGDPDRFIHLSPDGEGADATSRIGRLPCELSDLGISVSTGRVVDFRAREYLLAEAGVGSVPLIFPVHFSAGGIEWPKLSKKPNAIKVVAATSPLLVPAGYYVLVRRFSAKEERRRIVAAVFDPTLYPNAPYVGFENHLNYFHRDGAGLDPNLAFGLSAFLNSTVVDTFFRQFSGHTQVNAQDLRKLRFPAISELLRLGARVGGQAYRQEELDVIVDSELAEHEAAT